MTGPMKSITDYKYYLFDLDGTLTDSQEGIAKCVQYSLSKMGMEIPKAEDVLCFIGPPLVVSFKKFYQMNDEDAKKATAYYRERYKEVGLFENRVYDGIDELLEIMKSKGKVLAVATSKPQAFTERILEHFDLAKYFDVVVGSGTDGKFSTKSLVIEEALRQLSILHADFKKSEAIMIGDRMYDILGAKDNAIDSIGVYYGFADANELEEAGADYIVDTVDMFIKEFKR